MNNNLFSSFLDLSNISFGNYNIFNSIETALHQLQNDINITNITEDPNNDNFVEFNIEFEVIDENDDEINDNYFKNCYEINNKLGKSVKIKKNDLIETENCLICMEDYNCGQFKRLLPNCKHCFHKKCIDKWLKKKASCPICRDELKDK